MMMLSKNGSVDAEGGSSMTAREKPRMRSIEGTLSARAVMNEAMMVIITKWYHRIDFLICP